MSLSVGPIQSYVPDTAWFDLTKYSDLGTQERVSINLADSNLWLIDSSQLNLITDYAPRIAFLAGQENSDGTGYLAPLGLTTSGSTTGGISVFRDALNADGALSNPEAPLQLGDWVELSSLQGGTQIGFSAAAGGVTTSSSDFLNPSASFNSTNFGSSGSPILWTAYAAPSATNPLLLLGYEDAATADGVSDGVFAIDIGAENFNSIFASANLGQDPTINFAAAEPAPFEMHSALGLLTLGAIVMARRKGWWRRNQPLDLGYDCEATDKQPVTLVQKVSS